MDSIGWGELFAIGVGLWIAFGFGTYAVHALRRRRGQRAARELGLDVRPGSGLARRGAEVDALITMRNTEELGEVEAGLVCTESYDESDTDSDGDSYRTTNHATAFETWTPIRRLQGSQTVRLSIPAAVPFSYAGSCLSFKWELVVRGRRARQVDAEARSELQVFP